MSVVFFPAITRRKRKSQQSRKEKKIKESERETESKMRDEYHPSKNYAIIEMNKSDRIINPNPPMSYLFASPPPKLGQLPFFYLVVPLSAKTQ